MGDEKNNRMGHRGVIVGCVDKRPACSPSPSARFGGNTTMETVLTYCARVSEAVLFWIRVCLLYTRSGEKLLRQVR